MAMRMMPMALMFIGCVVMALVRGMVMARVVVMVMFMVIVSAMGSVHMRLFDLRASIGAAFGIEWRFNMGDFAAEPACHLFNNVVTPNADAIDENLNRQMAIAKMPGEAGEIAWFGHADFRKFFGRGDHFNQPPIFEHQRIAAPQHDRFGKIEQEFESMRAGHRNAPAMPRIEIEQDGIAGPGLPGALGADEICADHGDTRLRLIIESHFLRPEILVENLFDCEGARLREEREVNAGFLGGKQAA